ncbi:hypothetical protein BDR05DRAFT_1005709 [Suillus weaverae]|nr:hypothetical protein BDR05DRAFT_1005709 [Suillus weaverae]
MTNFPTRRITSSNIKELRFSSDACYYRQQFQLAQDYEDRWITIIYIFNDAYKTLHLIASTKDVFRNEEIRHAIWAKQSWTASDESSDQKSHSSQTLKSGWKANPEEGRTKSSAVSKVSTAVSRANEALSCLRVLCPNDLDVERAASSMMSKLLVLEMHDTALPFLGDIHARLLALLGVPDPKASVHSTPTSKSPIRLLSLLLPTIPPPADTAPHAYLNVSNARNNFLHTYCYVLLVIDHYNPGLVLHCSGRV